MTNAIGILETRSLALTSEILQQLLGSGKIELLNIDVPGDSSVVSFIFGEYSSIRKSIAIAEEISRSFSVYFNYAIITKPDDKLLDLLKIKMTSEGPAKDRVIKSRRSNIKAVTIDPDEEDSADQKIIEPELDKKPETEIVQNNESEKIVNAKPEKPEVKSGSSGKSSKALKLRTDNPTIARLQKEALGLKISAQPDDKAKAAEEKKQASSSPSLDELNELNVHKLRKHARAFNGFPIKGREISRANREELLNFFRDLI